MFVQKFYCVTNCFWRVIKHICLLPAEGNPGQSKVTIADLLNQWVFIGVTHWSMSEGLFIRIRDDTAKHLCHQKAHPKCLETSAKLQPLDLYAQLAEDSIGSCSKYLFSLQVVWSQSLLFHLFTSFYNAEERRFKIFLMFLLSVWWSSVFTLRLLTLQFPPKEKVSIQRKLQ